MAEGEAGFLSVLSVELVVHTVKVFLLIGNKALGTSPYGKQTSLVLITTQLSPMHVCPWACSQCCD